MATHQVITDAPTAIAGLAQGTVYHVQLSGLGAVYLETASTAPAADSPSASYLDSDHAAYVRNGAGESTYVWRASPGRRVQRLVINERIT